MNELGGVRVQVRERVLVQGLEEATAGLTQGVREPTVPRERARRAGRKALGESDVRLELADECTEPRGGAAADEYEATSRSTRPRDETEVREGLKALHQVIPGDLQAERHLTRRYWPSDVGTEVHEGSKADVGEASESHGKVKKWYVEY